MAEENNVVLIQPIDVPRNGVAGTFTEHKITRGKKKETAYPSLTINEANVEEASRWMGKQAVAGILNSFMKRIAQGWYDASVDNGEFNEAKFKTLAASFSVVGEGMKVLNERLRELQLELQKTDLAKIFALPDGDKDKVAFMELAQRIQSVSAAIENKRRTKTDADAEEEEKDAEPVSSV